MGPGNDRFIASGAERLDSTYGITNGSNIDDGNSDSARGGANKRCGRGELSDDGRWLQTAQPFSPSKSALLLPKHKFLAKIFAL